MFGIGEQQYGAKSPTISKKESTDLMTVLIAYADAGNNIGESLALKLKTERNKKVKTVIQSIISAINNSEPIPSALYRHGVLSEEERDMLSLKSSDSISQSFEKILEMREAFSERFERTFMFSLIPTIVTSYLVMVTLYLMSPEIVDFFDGMMKMTSLDAEMQSHVRAALSYAYHSKYLLYTLIGMSFVVFGGYGGYRYLYNTRRDLIYKIFPLKAIDDLPRIFQTMQTIQEAGTNTGYGIMEKMGMFESNQGLKGMFSELAMASKSKTGMHLPMLRYNLNYDIIVLVEAAEAGARFWDRLPSIVKASKRLSERSFQKWDKRISSVKSILPLVPILLAAISVVGANMIMSIFGVLAAVKMMKGGM